MENTITQTEKKLVPGNNIGLESFLLEESFGQVLKTCFSAINLSSRFHSINSDLEIKLADNPQDILKSYALRSSIYRDLGYDEEFKSSKNIFDVDIYDPHSLTLIKKEGVSVVGSSRIVIDNEKGLPSEKYFPNIADLKKNISPRKLTEISRLVIVPDKRGSKLFLEMFRTIYQIGVLNDFDYVFSVVDEHVPMYLKMGANIIKPSMSYGNMPKNVSIMFWGLENITPKYKELFKLRGLN